VVAVVLFTVGALFSVYEGSTDRPPGEGDRPVVALVVLAVAIVLESLSLRTALPPRVRLRSAASPVHPAGQGPELPTVLLEDMAALTGLIVALAGITMATVTGNGRWDGAGSLAIGVVLGLVAVILAIEMKSLLIGEAASASTERAVVTALEDGPELEQVIHLRTLHLGPDSLLIAAKVAVRASASGSAIARAIDAAEQRVRAAVPIAQVIYLEPDLYRAEEADTGDPAVRAALREPGADLAADDEAGGAGPPADLSGRE
jgi:divalent metal cation (Fe/Co/Zn/Cd) transporter